MNILGAHKCPSEFPLFHMGEFALIYQFLGLQAAFRKESYS